MDYGAEWCATPSGLVRVPLYGGAVEPLPFPDGSQATVALHGNRMVYAQPFSGTDIFRVPGPGDLGPVTRLISSTRREFAPQYSADGQRVVFVSDRAGSEEIWVVDSEGREPRQITSFAGSRVGSPRWSPDRKWIAFDSTAAGHPGIYVIAADGGTARRITSTAASCVRPSWSHDGRWIYFGSNQSGQWQIWKTPAQGGPPVQVTRNGGREAFEAPGGAFLYYAKSSPAIGIWRTRLSAGGDAVAGEVRVSMAGTRREDGRWEAAESII